ncbi:MAG: protein BatD [Candidatus Aminicenantes bacterium]|nr:protein BatD [Candidatus Aminicenantes bacterium]
MKRTGRPLCLLLLLLAPAQAGLRGGMDPGGAAASVTAGVLPQGAVPADEDRSPASVTAGISADKIGLEDTLVYTMSFRDIDNPSQPDLSHLDDFRVLQTSRSTEFQLRNGAGTSVTRFAYYLMPTRTGRLDLPAVRYLHQGREYRTQAFVIEVVQGRLLAGASPRPAPPSFFDDDFFSSPFRDRQPQKVDSTLRAVLSKTTCLRGEPLLFRVLLYTRDRIEAVNMLSGASFAGFWQEWFPVPRSITPRSENVNGVAYQVYEVRKATLFASETGTLSIPALEFELQLADPASPFFGTQPLRRSTQEVRVTVNDPPPAAAGLPIGRFSFSLDCPREKADINEIVTLRMEIRGSGNVKALIPPLPPQSAQVQVYPPKVTHETSFSPSALAGTLRADIPVAFKTAGVVEIPPVEFRYYDPARGAVVGLRSEPLQITVSGEKTSVASASTLPGSAIVRRGEDIDFIKVGPLRDRSRPLHRRPWYAALVTLLFAANLLVLLKTAVWDRHVAASRLVKNRRILALALGRLARVRSGEEIAPTLERYFQEKSGLGPAETSDERIAAWLRRKGIERERIDKLLFLKGQSDLARFSQLKKSALELQRDLGDLRKLLKEIDGKLK